MMIEPQVAQILKMVQRKTGAPASEHVRRAILLYLEKEFGITMDGATAELANRRAVEAAKARPAAKRRTLPSAKKR